MMFIAMIIVAVISLTTMAYALIWPKKKIQHNKCHTDNMKIEDLHGHTEPHVKAYSVNGSTTDSKPVSVGSNPTTSAMGL